MGMRVIGVVLCCVLSVVAEDWTGKKVSISGDSYSAFGTNQHYPGKTDVRSTGQMWWSQVISHFGGTLEVNGSRAGSAISYTYGVCPSIPYLAQDGNLGDPDIIMVMGGLNDFWVLAIDKSTFRTRANLFFNMLDSEYPSAEKIVILNKIHSNVDAKWGLAPMYRNVLRELAKGRGYRVVDLEGYVGMADGDFDTPEYPHPTRQGHAKIAQRVISALENWPFDYSRLLDTLEMDGCGYMVTDYVPNLKSSEISVTMRRFDQEEGETNVLFYASGYTAGSEDAGNMVSLVWRDGGIRYLNSTDSGLTNVAPRVGLAPEHDDNVVEIVTCGNTLSVGEYSLSSRFDASNVLASGNMVIGAMREGGSLLACFTGMAPKRIYGIKVRENGVVVRDYCPALNLEGKATLYDKVTGTCLGIYGGDGFRAVDFDGPYVNYSQYRAYDDFYEAYAAANPGETVVFREEPGETLSVTGRLDVAIDTRGLGDIEIVAPSMIYKIFKDGSVYRMGRNEDIIPRFACEKVSDLFVPVAGKLRLHIMNVVVGCTYSVYVARDLKGPWQKIGEGLEKADFEVDAPVDAKSFFIKAVMRCDEGD